MRDVAAPHVAEVTVLGGEYLGDREGVERVSAPELAERLSRGEVVPLDVRPEPEYWPAIFAGALSAPVRALRGARPSEPRRTEIVAYCRGPYCVYADDAVRFLQAPGLRPPVPMSASPNGDAPVIPS